MHTDTYTEFFLRELDREAPTTRKMLERVPADKFDWRPHDKSTKLGSLAAHLATLPVFVSAVMTTESLDVAGFKGPKTPTNVEELLAACDAETAKAREALTNAAPEEYEKVWSFTYGEKVIFSERKCDVIQSFFFNHIVHHRAQLGVYLRLLDIAIPGTYGPSADEQ